MKINQIVGEHKKGVRAMKYASKTKGTVPVYGPKANNGKLQPVKPQGPIEEAVLKAYDGKQATIDDPEHGKTINLDLTKPENAASLKPNEQGQLEYDPTPDMGTAGAQPGEASGPKPGTEVAIKADEEVGGDPTDNFINDVTDKDWERAQGREVDEASDGPNNTNTYAVDTSSGTPMAKSSPKPTAIVPSKIWFELTPDVEDRAYGQGFRKVYLSLGGEIVPGLEGGDMKLGSKIIVSPRDYQMLSRSNSATSGRSDRPSSAPMPKMRESADDILLQKMLTIAGLR